MPDSPFSLDAAKHIVFLEDFRDETYMLARRDMLQSSFIQRAMLARDSYADKMYPSAIGYPHLLAKRVTRRGEILAQALPILLQAWMDDDYLQRLIPVPKDVYQQLRRLDTIPYSLDWVRPDIVYPQEGFPQLCEINARFVGNGHYLSMAGAQSFIGRHQEELPGLITLHDRLRQQFAGQQWTALKAAETGWDIHLWRNADPGRRHIAHPQSYQWFLGHRLLLELRGNELAPWLERIVSLMLDGNVVINDPRTIYILHDKRWLAILHDVELLSQYLPKEIAVQLSQMVVPSFIRGRHPQQYHQASEQPADWLLKAAISGKGNGLLWGAQTDVSDWQQALSNDGWVLQPVVQQHTHRIWHPYFQRLVDVYTAGTLPIHGQECFGPTLERIYMQDNRQMMAVATTMQGEAR